MKLFVIVCVFLLLALGIWRQRKPQPAQRTEIVRPPVERVATNVMEVLSQATGTRANSTPATTLLGEQILRDYASPFTLPENDLNLMSHLMGNSLLLLKAAANRPLSANEDWADFFRGKNGAHERFLSDHHVAFNTQGQLVDRWKTPLFFHALGRGRYEVRSAGPDKVLWTADDIQRNADGSFQHGTNQNLAAEISPNGR
jgi:hypothetical protein